MKLPREVLEAAEAQFEWDQHPGKEEGDRLVAAAVGVDFVALARSFQEWTNERVRVLAEAEECARRRRSDLAEPEG